MEYSFTIHGTLPGLNDYLKAERKRSGKFNCGNEMKQKCQSVISAVIQSEFNRLQIRRPVTIHYIFYEPTKRRDLDNISATAHKFVQDALVSCGVLQDDGWNEIRGFTDCFMIDRKNPRIEIKIVEEAI